MSNIISFELADGCYVARWNIYERVHHRPSRPRVLGSIQRLVGRLLLS